MLKTNLTSLTVFIGDDYKESLMFVMVVDKKDADNLKAMVKQYYDKYFGRQHKILEEEYDSVDSYIEDMLEKQKDIEFAWAGGYDLHLD